MTLARVVEFDGMTKDRIEQVKQQMEEGERPQELPASEMMLLHNPDQDKGVAIIFFDNEDDYRKGDEFLSSMPASDTPGQRTAVTKYDVAVRTSG